MNNTDRNLEEQVSELERELAVRKRCYDRWVAEGKLSRVDARDRLERLQSALHTVQKVADLQAPELPGVQVPKTGDMPDVPF